MSQQYAQIEMRRQLTLIGAMAVHRGEADGMLCGTFGTHAVHRHYIEQVIGRRNGVANYAAMNAVLLPARTIFIADTYVNSDPTAEQLAEIALLAADEIRRFGITPNVALLSHSSFGTSDDPQARKMRAAVALIKAMDPDLEVEETKYFCSGKGFATSGIETPAKTFFDPRIKQAAKVRRDLFSEGGFRKLWLRS